MPLIKYLNKKCKNQNKYNEESGIKINKLNDDLENFFKEYHVALKNNINKRSNEIIKDKNADEVKKVGGNKKVHTIKRTYLKHIIGDSEQYDSMIDTFRKIIRDLLNILEVKSELVKNYNFLIKLSDNKKSHPKTGVQHTIEILFFIYFIINSDVENKIYMNKMTEFNEMIKPDKEVFDNRLLHKFSRLDSYLSAFTTAKVFLKAFWVFLSTKKLNIADYIPDFKMDTQIVFDHSCFLYCSTIENDFKIFFKKLSTPTLARLFYFVHQQNL